MGPSFRTPPGARCTGANVLQRMFRRCFGPLGSQKTMIATTYGGHPQVAYGPALEPCVRTGVERAAISRGDGRTWAQVMQVLIALRSLNDDWDGEGSEAPRPPAIAMAARVAGASRHTVLLFRRLRLRRDLEEYSSVGSARLTTRKSRLLVLTESSGWLLPRVARRCMVRLNWSIKLFAQISENKARRDVCWINSEH